MSITYESDAVASRGGGGFCLEARGVSMSFGGTRALQAVDFEIADSEIHGLLGENGSGKSTLIKILAGYHAPDAGDLRFRGKDVHLPLAVGASRHLGMEFVHQDLALIPSLSVLENLFIEEFAGSQRFFIRWGNLTRRARAVLREYGVAVDPDVPVSQLSATERALVAIIRAVEGERLGDARKRGAVSLLVLDEATVFLPSDGVARLFEILRRIRIDGASVLFVSHDLDEALTICDRITVLRDGRVTATVDAKTTTRNKLIELMLGMRLDASDVVAPQPRSSTAQPVTVERLTTAGLRDVAVDVAPGEVLGLTGLPASDFDAVPYALFGGSAATGTMRIGGREIELSHLTPSKAISLGIGFVPGDRQHASGVATLSVAENHSMTVLARYWRRLHLDRRLLRRDVTTHLSRFNVRPNDPDITLSKLSGGNQQKVILSKWLQEQPRLLLLHEPTQGVDVGARAEIFRAIHEIKARGAAVICASSDHEQLVAICDRVLVFRPGSELLEVVGDDINKHRLAELSFGG